MAAYILARTLNLTQAFEIANSVYARNGYGSMWLSAAQQRLGEHVWEAEDEERERIVKAYNTLVAELESRDFDAPCYETDPWSFDTYSDMYKDRYGFRPRGFIRGHEVREWMRDPQRDVEAAEWAKEEAEERYRLEMLEKDPMGFRFMSQEERDEAGIVLDL